MLLICDGPQITFRKKPCTLKTMSSSKWYIPVLQSQYNTSLHNLTIMPVSHLQSRMKWQEPEQKALLSRFRLRFPWSLFSCLSSFKKQFFGLFQALDPKTKQAHRPTNTLLFNMVPFDGCRPQNRGLWVWIQVGGEYYFSTETTVQRKTKRNARSGWD